MFASIYILVFVMVIFYIAIPNLSGLRHASILLHFSFTGQVFGRGWASSAPYGTDWSHLQHAEGPVWRVPDGSTYLSAAFVGMVRMLRSHYWLENLHMLSSG